jgi:restriction system protein
MTGRRKSDVNALIVLVLVVVLVIAAVVAELLSSWPGRVLLILILAGGCWTAIAVRRWRRARRRIHAATLDEMLALTPTEFEHLVAQLLRDQGYQRVQVTGQAGDLQADVTATSPDGRSTVVQCKRYTPRNRIGSPAIQSFAGMALLHHGAGLPMYVTTSSYTDPARQLARRHGIELIDGDQLVTVLVTIRDRQRAGARPQSASASSPPPPTPDPPEPDSA